MMHKTQVMTRPTLLLNDKEIHEVFDWRLAISALKQAYSQPQTDSNFPPRSMARGDGVWLRTLSGVFPNSNVMGSKQISASIKGKKASYLITLFDQNSSECLCLMDAQSITGFRTAATSILVIQHLLGHKVGKVGVVGSGFEAKTHVRALAAVMSVEHVEVFSPRAESRQRFLDDLKDTGVSISAVESAEQAVLGADVVICAARSKDESPTIKGVWLSDDMVVVSIGSTLPEQRELDEEAIRRACLIVADMPEEVAEDTGDMITAKAKGVDFEEKLVSLADLVQGRVMRQGTSGVVIYKSVGAALQDLAVAHMCYEHALEKGLGIELPNAITPVSK